MYEKALANRIRTGDRWMSEYLIVITVHRSTSWAITRYLLYIVIFTYNNYNNLIFWTKKETQNMKITNLCAQIQIMLYIIWKYLWFLTITCLCIPTSTSTRNIQIMISMTRIRALQSVCPLLFSICLSVLIFSHQCVSGLYLLDNVMMSEEMWKLI